MLVLAVIAPLRRLSSEFAENDLPKSGNRPRNLKIELPRRIYAEDRRFIGDDVLIGPSALLVTQTHYPTEVMQHPLEPRPVQTFSLRITIGNRVTSIGDLTLAAMSGITIDERTRSYLQQMSSFLMNCIAMRMPTNRAS